MKLILHIGTEKTGTTSIQKFLSINRELFLQHGYYIPLNMGHNNHRRIPSCCMREQRFDNFHKDNSILTIEDKIAFKKEVENDIADELSHLPNNIHTVIITSEHFHSRLKYQDEVDSVKELFSSYFDKFEVIVYVRRQIDMATSLYSTAIKGGSTETNINQFIKKVCRFDNHYYNYKIFLSMWEHTFNDAAITVRLFNKKEFHHGNLLLDFTNTISNNLIDEIKDKLHLPNNVNESLTVFGQDAMCIINRYMPTYIEGKGPNRKYIQMRRTIIEQCSGKGKQPDHNIALEVMETFFDINEDVCRKYFPNRKTLFDNALDIFSDIPSNTPENELKVLEEAVQMTNTVLTKEEIDTIRDIAVSLEGHSLEDAYSLMNIVQILRPKAVFVKRKLSEYKSGLEKQKL